MTKKPFLSSAMVLRAALILDFSISIFLEGNGTAIKYIGIPGFITLHLNDVFRVNYLKEKKILYFLSYFITVVGAACFLKYFDNSAVTIYFFFPLVESITGDRQIRYPAIAVHMLAYGAMQYGEPQSQLWTSLIIYGFIFIIAYLFRSNNQEKKKIRMLNEELQNANSRLEEYSKNVKKISIMEERSRIAQELHDSIGHGLVALGMNLEFAENVLITNPEKAKEAVHRAHGQSKKCLEDLRCAVTTLKSSPAETHIGLQDSLQQLFNSVSSGGVEIQLSLDHKAESAPAEVKDCTYRVIREAITNGIRHGNAHAFTIIISITEKQFTVIITDNGCGCQEIIKSHGFMGMENRAKALGGTVSYASLIPNGFEVKMELPLKDGMEGGSL